jgi:hypothetical protein
VKQGLVDAVLLCLALYGCAQGADRVVPERVPADNPGDHAACRLHPGEAFGGVVQLEDGTNQRLTFVVEKLSGHPANQLRYSANINIDEFRLKGVAAVRQIRGMTVLIAGQADSLAFACVNGRGVLRCLKGGRTPTCQLLEILL